MLVMLVVALGQPCWRLVTLSGFLKTSAGSNSGAGVPGVLAAVVEFVAIGGLAQTWSTVSP